MEVSTIPAVSHELDDVAPLVNVSMLAAQLVELPYTCYTRLEAHPDLVALLNQGSGFYTRAEAHGNVLTLSDHLELDVDQDTFERLPKLANARVTTHSKAGHGKKRASHRRRIVLENARLPAELGYIVDHAWTPCTVVTTAPIAEPLEGFATAEVAIDLLPATCADPEQAYEYLLLAYMGSLLVDPAVVAQTNEFLSTYDIPEPTAATEQIARIYTLTRPLSKAALAQVVALPWTSLRVADDAIEWTFVRVNSEITCFRVSK